MDYKQLDALERDLDRLVAKHGLKNSAFCGSLQSGEFFGKMIGPGGKKSFPVQDGFEVALNIGRLWQHARSTVRDSLAVFDRWSPSGK